MREDKRDIITLREFDKEEILHILRLAKVFSAQESECLKGSLISTLFFEPSTRTRTSFQTAAMRLGAQINGFDSSSGTSAQKGENFSDTIKMMEYYCDAMVIRSPFDGAAKLASTLTSKPVINAGDGVNQHPSQTLLDLYTIQEQFGRLDNLNIACVGDLKNGRTVHSLIEAMKHFNVKFYFIAPESLQIPEKYLEKLKSLGIEYEVKNEFESTLERYDVLYMTRVQKERFESESEYEKVAQCFQLTEHNIVGKCKASMIILHPLPRVDEISRELDSTQHALYFKQAGNGIPVRKAMLALVLGKVEKLKRCETLMSEISDDFCCSNSRCISNVKTEYLKHKAEIKNGRKQCYYCEK